MGTLFNLTKIAALILLAAVWTSAARADPAGTTARALVADWKAEDREMAAVAEVIASAFASGMSWAGTIEGHPLYCPPPTGAFRLTKPTALRSPPACGRRSHAPIVERGSARHTAGRWRTIFVRYILAECATSTA